jgi:predicted membrane-bound spermidine synthase
VGSSRARVASSPSLWVLFTAGGLAALGHEAARVHELYVRPQGAATWGVAVAVAALTSSVVVSRWLRSTEALAERNGRRESATPEVLLLAASALALLMAVLPFEAFDHGRSALVVACACEGTGVFVAAWAALETWHTVARTTLALGLVEEILRPLFLLGVASFAAAALWLEARVGFLRGSVLVAAWLALCAGTYSAARARVGAPSSSSPWPTRAAVAIVLAAFGVVFVADRRLPLSELARYPDEIVFASDGAAHRYVITAAPGGYELFRDGQLRVAALDASRYAAAVALPAVRATTGGRVLLLDGGEGVVEQTILSAPGVTELTIVSEDDEARRLSARVPFLGNLFELAGGALTSDHLKSSSPLRVSVVRHVTAELMPWLAASEDRWDVVVANLGAPLGYGEGKYYTRHFCRLLSQHLAPHGLVVMPATSAFAAPEAFDDVRATLASAGLHVRAYHASIPTLGVASFLVGSLTDGADALDALDALDMLGGSADLGRDLARVGSGRVATLYDERVVDGFAVSRERRGE